MIQENDYESARGVAHMQQGVKGVRDTCKGVDDDNVLLLIS